MIFGVPGHVELIKTNLKIETRRGPEAYDRYQVGKTYAIQPKRTAKGIAEGRILIANKWLEWKKLNYPISTIDAIREGSYTPEDYEKLYEKLKPKWSIRAAFLFEFVASEVK